MKSRNFTVGIGFKIKARSFKLLISETNDSGWTKIVLADDEQKVFLEESLYTEGNLRQEKIIKKIHKKVEKLEENYKSSGASANMIRLLKQSKQIIKSL